MKTDMSPDAVTNRMKALDQLWELAVALKSSVVLDEPIEETDQKVSEQEGQNDKAVTG